MIHFQLRCGNDHAFEAWFRDNATYEEQLAHEEVVCPICGDVRIVKAPMAPAVLRGGDARKRQQLHDLLTERHRQMMELRQHVERNFDYVGEAFADEARAIHYGEAEERNIYGESSAEEAVELMEEGIPVTRVPWPDATN